MSKSIFSNGFIYEGVEDFKPDLEEVYTDASLNAAFVRHLKKFPYFQYLGDNLKEWQTVLEGVDYEKGYQGWNFIEQKWEDVTQEDYEHLLDPARCIIAKPLPVNQSTKMSWDDADGYDQDYSGKNAPEPAAQIKAKELIERFWPFVEHVTDGFHDKELERENAKQCAIICVKEILKIYEHIDEEIIKRKEEYRPLEEYDFWQQVLTNINNLK